MDRLNYFNPYNSKDAAHEDQLTRAYLVLLRYSFHAFSAFFDYIRGVHTADESRDERPLLLNQLVKNGWEICTQKGNPVIRTNWLLSVLITDNVLGNAKPLVTSSDRGARYDGLITFGDELTIIIENKPRSANVWFNQLNPSKEHLSEETKVYSSSINLEWKEIIEQLNRILLVPTAIGVEKMLIEDFLSFIDARFPHLNPFDKFHLCKGNHELIQRRIHSLLKSIVIDEECVKYHNSWGYYINTPYGALKEIGLILNDVKEGWFLELSFYFGDTQSQARTFYSSMPYIDHLSEGWYCVNNFHVSFRSSNLVWFREIKDHKRYIEFWKENIDNIYQQKRHEVAEYLQWLEDERVIQVTPQEQHRLNEKFYNTAMQTLNICPGFGAIFEISDKEAEELDKSGQLRTLLLKVIKDGLQIIHKDGIEFLTKN